MVFLNENLHEIIKKKKQHGLFTNSTEMKIKFDSNPLLLKSLKPSITNLFLFSWYFDRHPHYRFIKLGLRRCRKE